MHKLKINHLFYTVLKILLCATLLLGLGSCGMLKHSVKNRKHTSQYTVKEEKELEKKLEHNLKGDEKKIIEEAFEWLETPYSYGRQDKGIATDCSGFVMRTFEVAIGCKLPRNSAKQAEFCEEIKGSKVKPGDLVFFITNNGSKINHVGIMINATEFIHASSKGVRVASMESDYYKKHFIQFGRVPCIKH